MEIEKSKRKELIKRFRQMVNNGQEVSRSTLLAYAYLRGVPYVKLERVINEDKFPPEQSNKTLGSGIFWFLRCLANRAAYEIHFQNQDLDREVLKNYIYFWILEKYENDIKISNDNNNEVQHDVA